MAKEVAVIEDEAAIAENYRDVLQRHGYAVSVYPGRPEALAAFQEKLPQLVVVDVGLGDEPEGGFDLCRELRAMAPQLPIIFLSARDSDLDVISGLRLGADDYLTKDISLPHLVARITALFRRVEAFASSREAAKSSLLGRGELQLDLERFQARWQDRPLDLTLTEFWLVHALARFPGHVKNRQQLMDAANVVLDDSTITSHIKRLRRKFQALDTGFDAIDTVYGAGYRWKAE